MSVLGDVAAFAWLVVSLPWLVAVWVFGRVSDQWFGPPPGPATAKAGPAQCFLSPDQLQASSDALNLDCAALNRVLQSVVDEQVASGRQLGVAVSVYVHGHEVAYVGGGLVRSQTEPRRWRTVAADTLFLVNSVTKSVCAAAFLALLDRGLVDYDEPVASRWAGLAAGAGSKLTVAEALSHRAGLPNANGSVFMCILKNLVLFRLGGWTRAWSSMKATTAQARPEWAPCSQAEYHPVSYSWILGGIVESVFQGGHIRELVRECVAAPLGVPSDDLNVGRVDPCYDHRIARTEGPRGPLTRYRRTACAAAAGNPTGSWLRWLELHLVGPLEGWAIGWLMNVKIWRRLCLPSSNGVFTANAVGRVFGALANDGVVHSAPAPPSGPSPPPRPRDEDGMELEEKKAPAATTGLAAPPASHTYRLVSKATLDKLQAKIGHEERPPIKYVHPDGCTNVRARLSCGFFPWINPDLHGAGNHHVLNHEGMGGCCAWADPRSGLAMVYLHTVYEPLSMIGGSVSQDACDAAVAVREFIQANSQ